MHGQTLAGEHWLHFVAAAVVVVVAAAAAVDVAIPVDVEGSGKTAVVEHV